MCGGGLGGGGLGGGGVGGLADRGDAVVGDEYLGDHPGAAQPLHQLLGGGRALGQQQLYNKLTKKQTKEELSEMRQPLCCPEYKSVHPHTC